MFDISWMHPHTWMHLLGSVSTAVWWGGGDENLGWAKHLSLPGLYPTDEYSSSRSSADKRMLAPSWEVPSIQQFCGPAKWYCIKKKVT